MADDFDRRSVNSDATDATTRNDTVDASDRVKVHLPSHFNGSFSKELSASHEPFRGWKWSKDNGSYEYECYEQSVAC
jgi:hypothetical protein